MTLWQKYCTAKWKINRSVSRSWRRKRRRRRRWWNREEQSKRSSRGIERDVVAAVKVNRRWDSRLAHCSTSPDYKLYTGTRPLILLLLSPPACCSSPSPFLSLASLLPLSSLSRKHAERKWGSTSTLTEWPLIIWHNSSTPTRPMKITICFSLQVISN